MISQRNRILPPYTRRVRDTRHALSKTAVIGLLILFAMFMGFWIGVFGTIVIQPFGAFIAILLLLALWLADDTNIDLRPQTTIVFLWFMAALALWPSYLAIDIPGLPWITPVRILLALMMFLLLWQMAHSSRARGELAGVAGAIKPALICYGIFWLFALGTFLLSKTPGESLSYSMNWLVLWNMPFVAAAWVLVDKSVMPKLVRILLYCLAFVFVLTVMEYTQRKPIWFDHIPSFLKIDGPLFEMIMQEQGRVGDDRYRARGNFSIHLYFAQYVLMLTPFIVHAAFTETFRKQVAALAMLAFTLVICWMTNTRTAMTGFIVVVAGSVALYGLRRFLNPTSKADMVAPAIFLAAPAGIITMLLLIAASPRLQSQTLGGYQHSGSDAVRDNQWERAIAAVIQNPIGHGGNNSGPIAGRQTTGGIWIVDSTWINFLIDFGLFGTLGFAAFGALIMYWGVRIYLKNVDESADLCGPAAVAVGSFLMTMYTISFAGNFLFMLVIVASIAATRFRLMQEGVLKVPVKPPPLSALASKA